MNVHKIYLICLMSTIILCGISVSASQFFLFLTFVFLLFDRRNKNFFLTPITVVSFLLFFWYFASAGYHLILDKDYFNHIFKSEIKDFLLFSAFFVFLNLKDDELPKIEKTFRILVIVLLLTGLVSAFSSVRLSRLFNDLFRESTAWRYTHHYGDILGIGIYLPIGLMNTHLTFGGLLLLFFPAIFYKFILSIKEDKARKSSFLFLLLFLFIFLLNNARSALLGSIVSIVFGFIDIAFIKKAIDLKKVIKLIIIPIGILFILFAILLSNATTRQFITPLLGEKKHTDSGRTFIWNSTFPMIQKKPIFGIGPGNYLQEVDITRKELSTDEKELSFFYEVTQRGHSHNDFLHLAAIAGIPSLLLYLTLIGLISYTILDKTLNVHQSILFYGLIGFFFSGLFQCYFQDDEVVIVFWLLLGFLLRMKKNYRLNI